MKKIEKNDKRTTLEMYREYCQALDEGEVFAVSISEKNSKMGRVPSVSLPAVISCPSRCKGTCGEAGACYALKTEKLRPFVRASYARNLAILHKRPAQYWTEVEAACQRSRFFRFHVSGDIVNADYFAHMIEIATRCPWCQILAFTKNYEVVNAWMDQHGDLPENLHVLFSGWYDMIDVASLNPHNLPTTEVYDETPAENWLLCGGCCETCGCRGLGCWQAKKGDTIAFKKH